MNRPLVWAVALLLTQSAAWAQTPSRIYSQPAVPRQDVLDRLNLRLAWYTYMPVDGRRDGFALVQIFDDQMIVQLRSGAIVALSPHSGDTQWRARVGLPYPSIRPVGVNVRSVFVINGDRLFALDRRTGAIQWEYRLPLFPATGPIADAERLYLALGLDRLTVYQLPGPTTPTDQKPPPLPPVPTPEASRPPPLAPTRIPIASGSPTLAPEVYRSAAAGPQPTLLWDFVAERRIVREPLQSEEFILFPFLDGTFMGTEKRARQVAYRYLADRPPSAPLAQHTDVAYIPSQDFNVYALDMPTGRLVWRFTGATPIVRKPDVNDDDVYVVTEGVGLYRIARATGEMVWRSPPSHRFLAANPKYVYAMNPSNQMLILDRARGTQLALFDTRDFSAPISNEVTDRIYLASHDGLLVCLHDLDYRQPVRMKKTAEPPEGKPAAAPSVDVPAPQPPADRIGDKMPEEKLP